MKVGIIRWATRRRLGRSIRPVETMAAHPPILIAYTSFSQAVTKASAVDRRLKILAVVRAANLVECPF